MHQASSQTLAFIKVVTVSGDLLGSMCMPSCDRGRSPFGQAVCRRGGKFVVDGLPEGVGADAPGGGSNSYVDARIGCEYQCKRLVRVLLLNLL